MGYTDAANHDQMHRERIAKEHAVLHNALASDLIAAERKLERQGVEPGAGTPAGDDQIEERLSQLQLRIESALDDRG